MFSTSVPVNQFIVRMKLGMATLTLQNEKQKLEKGGHKLSILEWPHGLVPSSTSRHVPNGIRSRSRPDAAKFVNDRPQGSILTSLEVPGLSASSVHTLMQTVGISRWLLRIWLVCFVRERRSRV